jgi:hypothetical protein
MGLKTLANPVFEPIIDSLDLSARVAELVDAPDLGSGIF